MSAEPVSKGSAACLLLFQSSVLRRLPLQPWDCSAPPTCPPSPPSAEPAALHLGAGHTVHFGCTAAHRPLCGSCPRIPPRQGYCTRRRVCPQRSGGAVRQGRPLRLRCGALGGGNVEGSWFEIAVTEGCMCTEGSPPRKASLEDPPQAQPGHRSASLSRASLRLSWTQSHPADHLHPRRSVVPVRSPPRLALRAAGGPGVRPDAQWVDAAPRHWLFRWARGGW